MNNNIGQLINKQIICNKICEKSNNVKHEHKISTAARYEYANLKSYSVIADLTSSDTSIQFMFSVINQYIVRVSQW